MLLFDLYFQAAYHLAKPAVLTQQLLSLDINEDKVRYILQFLFFIVIVLNPILNIPWIKSALAEGQIYGAH